VRDPLWNPASLSRPCGPSGRAGGGGRQSAYRARVALVALSAYVQACSQPGARAPDEKSEHLAKLIRVERPAGVFFFPNETPSDTPVTKLTVRIIGDSDSRWGRVYTLFINRDYDPKLMGVVGDRVVFVYEGVLPIQENLDRQRLAAYAVQKAAP
jgi:hypothetical protein